MSNLAKDSSPKTRAREEAARRNRELYPTVTAFAEKLSNALGTKVQIVQVSENGNEAGHFDDSGYVNARSYKHEMLKAEQARKSRDKSPEAKRLRKARAPSWKRHLVD